MQRTFYNSKRTLDGQHKENVTATSFHSLCQIVYRPHGVGNDARAGSNIGAISLCHKHGGE